MEQRDAPSEPPSDAVDGDSDPSFVERYFWPLLVGVILLAATGSVGVVYMQYGQVDQALQSVPYVDQASQYADQAARAIPYVSPADSSARSSGEPRDYGSFAKMKGLVANPAGSGGNRYLAVSLAFESKSPSAMQELETKKVVVRDAVLTILSEQTVDEVSNPDRRDELKKMLREKTNSILSSGTVDRLYFTEFVLQ